MTTDIKESDIEQSISFSKDGHCVDYREYYTVGLHKTFKTQQEAIQARLELIEKLKQANQVDKLQSQHKKLVDAIQDVIDNHAGEHIPYMMQRLQKAIEESKCN